MSRHQVRSAAVIAVVAALVAAGCSSSGDDPQASGSTAAVTAPTATTGDCPTGLEGALAAWGAAGFNGTVAVVDEDGTCAGATGLQDREAGEVMAPDDVFAIGSISKSFTAAAIMGLVAEGRLSLEDRLGDVLGDLTGPVADATIEQLLTHTSGLVGDAGPDHQPLSRSDAITAISALPQAFEPGTDFGYTNAGYTLLALVIDEVTGDYRRYMSEEVLAVAGEPTGAGFWDGEPAAQGRRAVGYLDEGRTDVMGDFEGPHWATGGNGDLAMSTPALAAWTLALFTGDVVPAEAVDVIGTPRWDHGDGLSEALGWVHYDESLYGTAGFASAGGGGDTGHDTIVAFLPATETAVAIASSTPDITAEQLMEQVIAALMAGEPIPHPQVGDPVDLDQATIDEVTGTYTLPDGGELAITGDPDSDMLTVTASGAPAVEALFNLPEGFRPGDVAHHEQRVVELLTGDDPLGADERDALDATVGAIDDVTVAGTVVVHGEMRTYVTVTGPDGALNLWYSLTDLGTISAAQGPTDPPAATFTHQSDGTFLDADPTGARSDVRLTFGDGTVRVEDGASTVTARTSS
jgi:CubicO group peptidase (beta-lactamase class C family)